MSRAVGLLSRREHGRIELARKLRRHLGPDETIGDLERLLDQLQQQNLLSDARYAAGLVRQRATRYGDAQVAHQLRERGIDADNVRAALAPLAGSEVQRAHAVWSRRFDALPTSAEERGRQGRFLQSRGFSMDTISRVLAGRIDVD